MPTDRSGEEHSERPPSVDALARRLAPSGLPHAVLVSIARDAIQTGDVSGAAGRAAETRDGLLGPVVNATGVLLHTNLGRAPLASRGHGWATNLEFDLTTGARGRRAGGVERLTATLCGAEAALVVNNCAGAVLLVLAAIASRRQVLVSRGESVEIGGGFRIPEVAAQSGATLVDVGTTNKTRISDYERSLGPDVACILRVHRSNFRIDGFTEAPSVAELAALDVPLVVDLGSGFIDTRCPWLPGGPPAWLEGEPAVRQLLASGADLVVFSGDKIMGGPQSGIIAGRADLVDRCRTHPLARALRPGAMTMTSLQEVVLAYLRQDVDALPFWAMATAPVSSVRARAQAVVATVGAPAIVTATEATPGAGCTPGRTIPSFGVAVPGDVRAALRSHAPPVIARVNEGRTLCDLRSVPPDADHVVTSALDAALSGRQTTCSSS